MKHMAIGVATLAVASLVAAPVAAHAATDVVFFGGTGTGMLPWHDPHVGGGFVKPFVTDVDSAVSIRYDGAPWANPHTSVPVALEAIGATDDPTVVIGASKGAQLARAAEQQDLRSDTTYVLIGDPDGRNGLSRTFGFSAPAPEEVRHNVIEVAAEYDGVADFPDRPLNLVASANALAGWAWGDRHNTYGAGDETDPLTDLDKAKVTVRDNLDANGKPNGTTTTHMLIPANGIPLTKPLRDLGVDTSGIDAPLKKIIDRGYSRNDGKEDDGEDRTARYGRVSSDTEGTRGHRESAGRGERAQGTVHRSSGESNDGVD